MIIVYIVGTIRSITSLLILWSPFWMALISTIIDAADHTIFVFTGVRGPKFTIADYEEYDKFYDLVQYIFMAIASWFLPGRWFLIGLFAFRMVGNVLFMIFKERKWFLFFPNIFEVFYFAHLFFLKFLDTNIFENITTLVIVFVVSTIIKVVNEYLVHWDGCFPFAKIYERFGKDYRN